MILGKTHNTNNRYFIDEASLFDTIKELQENIFVRLFYFIVYFILFYCLVCTGESSMI